MAELHELIAKIENPELRAQIQGAVKTLLKQKSFGLVFENHRPECTPLYDISVRSGLLIQNLYMPFTMPFVSLSPISPMP